MFLYRVRNAVIGDFLCKAAIWFRSSKTSPETVAGLARIIHIFEDNKSLLCYKHVVETMFAATKEALRQLDSGLSYRACLAKMRPRKGTTCSFYARLDKEG